MFRENLVVLDEECHLYHVVVKGLHVRDGKEVNSQVQNKFFEMPIFFVSQLNMFVEEAKCHAFSSARQFCQITTVAHSFVLSSQSEC